MTKTEKIAFLRSRDPQGRNAAIQRNIARHEAMTDAEFLISQKASEARSNDPAVQASVKRMAAEVMRKVKK